MDSAELVRPASGSASARLNETRAPRVAVVSVGDPRSPGTWSGTTAGILAGLERMGIQTLAVDASLPGLRERALLASAAAPTRNRYDAEGAALVHRARSLRVRRALRRQAVDGAIQIGTTFALPAGVRFVPLEDMTLSQATAVHPVFSRMSGAVVAAWERRRAEIYRAAHMCAPASHWTADSLHRDYGIARARMGVVGFGANHIAPASERRWEPPRFLFIGIDWERKGGPALLRAFARLRDTVPAATLDVVGGHPPLTAEGVSFHGLLSRRDPRQRGLLLELLARASCFVMPSLVEPFGIAYLEAAAAGIPSIATSIGGPADAVGSDAGVVVDPRDEDALVAAMTRLADPETAKRMGAAARERAKLYTWPCVAERLLRALELEPPDGRALAQFL
jgi:glycogen synthase